MPDTVRTGEYYVQVNFERGAERPARVFTAMAQLIESLQMLDVHLAQSIDAAIEPVVILQEVEAGSIRAWLATVLRSVDDEALKQLEWKAIVGSYLVKGKARALRFLEGKQTVLSPAEIEALEAELIELAEETQVRQIPAYAPVPRRLLLEDLNAVSSAVSVLNERESAVASLDQDTIEIEKHFNVPQEVVESLATSETIQNESEIILKVKKPDYLGQSMWEFHHEGHIIEAKIADLEWLGRFQRREFTIGPGDALRVRLTSRINYDQFGTVVSSHREVVKVLAVINPPPGVQPRLWLE